MDTATLTARIILEAIARRPGCSIEEVLGLHPDLTWNQVFAEIDRLSRAGALLVTLKGRGAYALSLPPHKDTAQYPRCDIVLQSEEARGSLEGGEPQRKVEAA